MTKIAIIGTGAMGSVYAGLLADAGNEVWAIDTWADHIDAIKASGLRVTGASGERTVRMNASTRAADAGVCDLVIIATKADGVVTAARSAEPLIGPDTIVLTIQNGLGSADRVTSIVDRKHVLIGIVGGFGSCIKQPGYVHHEGWELLHLGEAEGLVTSRLRKVAELWSAAGFSVRTYGDLDLMIWEKFICNVCYSGICTITELTIGDVLADRDAWAVASGCATEAWQVARALGIAVAIDDPVEYVRAFGKKIANARPSMLLDLMAGRRSEIDVINGAVPVQAERVGLRAPYNEVVAALVRQRETARLGPRA